MTIAQLIYYRKECGLTYREISERTGIPWTTIAGRCQQLGIKPDIPSVPMRTRSLVKYKDIDPKLLKKLYWEEFKSIGQIAIILGIPKPSVASLFKFHNIPRRTHVESAKLRAKLNPESMCHQLSQEDRLKGREVKKKNARRRARRRAYYHRRKLKNDN